MKIGFVIPDMRGGGAERVFVTLVNNLITNGHDVSLIVSKKSGNLLDSLIDDVDVFELNHYGIRSIFRLRKVVIDNKFDVLIGTLNMAYVVAVLKLFLPNSCVMISRLGNTISSDLENHKGVIKLIQKIYQYVLLFSDRIIVQSKSMEYDLYEVVRFSKIREITQLIYNPIDEHRVLSLSNDVEPSSLINRSDIVTVGRLEKQKDHITTILAFNEYQKVHKNVKLHILGDGSLREYLVEFVSDLNLTNKIIFHGHVSNPYSYIANAKILVMSSLYEGFSNVILESICLHTPVVASDCPGGNSEIITDGVNGFLFKTGCYLDMSEKMVRATNCTFTDFSVLNYSVDKIADEYLDAFNV